MKIADGFIFNDELDLLELRLQETGDLVDRFVLVEFAHDFQQHPKPLHYHDNRKRFAEWNDRITHIIAEIPLGPHPVIEHAQRRMIALGFADLDFKDYVMVGDVDEIPSREALEFVRKNPPDRPCVLQQHLYYYRVTNHAGIWRGTVILPRGVGRLDCQLIRDHRGVVPVLPVPTGGWHFSWMGDAEDVRKKLRNIDVKRDNLLYDSRLPDIPDSTQKTRIERAVALGDDLFGRKRNYATVEISPGVMQPTCIKGWLKDRPKYA